MEYNEDISRYDTLQLVENDSVFLFGARMTGKSTLLRSLFPDVRYYDLLKADVFEKLNRAPSLLREELMLHEDGGLVIIDEIQQIPKLLDEVHWLIENKKLRFVLCGSSARKLKRSGVNTLGGRALKSILYPFVSAELKDFNLLHAINNGMIPRHYLVENAQKRLQAYVGIYLQEEIKAETLVRNLSSFNRFLEAAALTDGEMVNYNNIASDCGVSAKTAKEYFTILEETLVGYFVPAYTKVVKRRLIQAPRFYLFDVGVVNYLLHRTNLKPGSIDFGHALEHFIIQEIIAYLGYSDIENGLSYWRTSGGVEVDAILGDAKVAIEIKSVEEVKPRHIKGLKVFSEEHPDARLIIISLDETPRIMDGIEILPATLFLKMLWNKQIYVE